MTVDESDQQSLDKISADITRLVDELRPSSAAPPRSKWISRAGLQTIASDWWLLLPTAVLALLAILHAYYLCLYWLSPASLYPYAHAAYPWLFLPYAVAPTAYRHSYRLIGAVLDDFCGRENIAEIAPLQAVLRGSPGQKRRDAVRRLVDALLNSPYNKAHRFVDYLKSLAPKEALALEAVGQIPTDPEIIWAREQMSSILQVPQGTVSKPGLTLEHTIRQATTISGDFYNIIPRGDGSLGVYMVDVNGHGLAASLHALQTSLLLKTAEPQWGLGRPEQQLDVADDLMRKLGKGFAVCMNFLEIDLAEGMVRYASAGMPPALLFRRGRSQPVQLQAAGHYVGKGYKFCGVKLRQFQHQIGEGDMLVLYSDGVIEARGADLRCFGTDGVEAAVRTADGRDARAVRDSIMEACTRFSASPQPYDDQSLVVVQIGTPSAPSLPGEDVSLHVTRTDPRRIEATFQNTADAPSAVLRFLNESLLPFAESHLGKGDAATRVNPAVLEILTNCLRHGTPKGEFLEIMASAGTARTLEIKLVQSNEWKSFYEMHGRHRLQDVAARRAAFKRGETPEVRFLGTELVVVHSFYCECSQDGREQRFGFAAETPMR